VPGFSAGGQRPPAVMGWTPAMRTMSCARLFVAVILLFVAGSAADVEREFRDFLTCGVLAHGFARLRCRDRAFERFVPFSWSAITGSSRRTRDGAPGWWHAPRGGPSGKRLGALARGGGKGGFGPRCSLVGHEWELPSPPC
jgi:hypothetical protein